MMNFKKRLLISVMVILALFSACNLSFFDRKSGEIVVDLSEFNNKRRPNSRSTIDELFAQNEVLFADLSLEGSYNYNTTINLREASSFAIEGIPVGSQVKAVIQLYTFTNPDDSSTRKVLYAGESAVYTIAAGVNDITVTLKKQKIEEDPENPVVEIPEEEEVKWNIYVTYDEQKQGLDAWSLQHGAWPEEEPDKDGKTALTGFNYIQSAIKWIADNGDSETPYQIVLTGYESAYFNQCMIFGTQNYEDNLDGHAKSITLTSDNPGEVALSTSSYDTIVVATRIPVILTNI